jgi:hypothetical protein
VTVDGVTSDDVVSVTLGQCVDIAMAVRSDFDFEIRGEFRMDCYFQGPIL